MKSWVFLAGAALGTIMLGMRTAPTGLGAEIVFRTAVGLLVIELLVNQAKYLWNDLRDAQRDRGLPGHDDRWASESDPTLIHWNIGVRLALAMAIGALFAAQGVAVLLIATGALVGLQVLYEKVTKFSVRFPFARVLNVSASYPVRFLCGALIAIGWPTPGEYSSLLLASACISPAVAGIFAEYYRAQALMLHAHGAGRTGSELECGEACRRKYTRDAYGPASPQESHFDDRPGASAPITACAFFRTKNSSWARWLFASAAAATVTLYPLGERIDRISAVDWSASLCLALLGMAVAIGLPIRARLRPYALVGGITMVLAASLLPGSASGAWCWAAASVVLLLIVSFKNWQWAEINGSLLRTAARGLATAVR